MIKINIESSDKLNDDAINILFDAARFYINQLLPKCKSLHVDIIIDDDIELKVDGYTGSVEIITPHHYEICIDDSLSRKQMLISLAHELVHVKQIETRQFTTLKNGSKQWNGLFYTNKIYKDAPWEVEAFEKEQLLYRAYMNK